jgi:hypothetical protein
MNSTSFGDFMTTGGFIQKTAPGTTVIYSKQANRRQQVIQLATTAKDNSRRFYWQSLTHICNCQLSHKMNQYDTKFRHRALELTISTSFGV